MPLHDQISPFDKAELVQFVKVSLKPAASGNSEGKKMAMRFVTGERALGCACARLAQLNAVAAVPAMNSRRRMCPSSEDHRYTQSSTLSDRPDMAKHGKALWSGRWRPTILVSL
jgi:hypothetical protein